MSVMVHPVIIFVCLRFFISDATRALAWSVIVMALSIALRMTSMLFAVNSLLGLRSMVPTLLPLLLLVPGRRSVRVGFTGVAFGCALVMGTEQGLAVSLALIIATAAIAWRSDNRAAYIVDTVIELAIGGITLVAILTILGGARGMAGALEYNFRLVPEDQYWYFGAPPNLFLSSWGAIPQIVGVDSTHRRDVGDWRGSGGVLSPSALASRKWPARAQTVRLRYLGAVRVDLMRVAPRHICECVCAA